MGYLRSWRYLAVSFIKRVHDVQLIEFRPITRLFYNSDNTMLYICSYDRSIKRFDMNSMKVETIFKATDSFDADVFIHHCAPNPTNETQFYISLSNG